MSCFDSCLNLVLNDDCFTLGTKFVALVIPSSPGAMFDLTSNQYMAGIVTAFIRENSKFPFWSRLETVTFIHAHMMSIINI